MSIELSAKKDFSLTLEVLRKIVALKEREKVESERIFKLYNGDSKVISMEKAFERWQDEQAGIINRPAYKELESYLLSLTIENIVDLALLMYLGRDRDCNMYTAPGNARFSEFYSRYDDVVFGKSKEILVDTILEKAPLLMYLRTGYRLLFAPVGASVDDFPHNWNEM